MSYPGRDLEAGGRKKRTVALKDALKGVKLAAGLPSESKSNLFLFLFFFFVLCYYSMARRLQAFQSSSSSPCSKKGPKYVFF